MAKLLAPIWPEVSHVSPREIFRDVFTEHANDLQRPEDYVNHSLYFEAKTFLHGLLVVEDKLSMAHGLETRVPFLDNDLVDFAMRVPARMKLGNLERGRSASTRTSRAASATAISSRRRDGKLLLRKTMARHLPKEIADREKQGLFGAGRELVQGRKHRLCPPQALSRLRAHL